MSFNISLPGLAKSVVKPAFNNSQSPRNSLPTKPMLQADTVHFGHLGQALQVQPKALLESLAGAQSEVLGINPNYTSAEKADGKAINIRFTTDNPLPGQPKETYAALAVIPLMDSQDSVIFNLIVPNAATPGIALQQLETLNPFDIPNRTQFGGVLPLDKREFAEEIKNNEWANIQVTDAKVFKRGEAVKGLEATSIPLPDKIVDLISLANS